MSQENLISKAIIANYSQKLIDYLTMDVALVGGGPSALVAAAELAKKGYKVAIFERSLAPGGGIWGGGMLFNEVVVQDSAANYLQNIGIHLRNLEEAPGYFMLDSVEMASGLIFNAMKTGAKIFNSVCVEDIVFKENKVNGLVINWNNVRKLGQPVDPLTIIAKVVVDATGHPCEIIRIATEKARISIDTETGKVMGERPMWVENGEDETVKSTKEYYPGLFACGMSASNVTGSYRMGPIFGGMILSGIKVAEQIDAKLKAEK
ncbi:MAG: sulfide-dependent adenosine diphosphate thiazole synthase [Lentisphaeria bacterium]